MKTQIYKPMLITINFMAIMAMIIASYIVFVSEIDKKQKKDFDKLNLEGTCFSLNKTKSDSLGLRFVSDEKTVITIEGCK